MFEIIMLIVMIAMIILMQPEPPKPVNATPADPSSFQAPTSHDKPIPVVFGTSIVKSASAIKAGKLQTKAIWKREEGEWFIIGYEYKIGMDMALCHGPNVNLRQVIINERVKWTNNADLPAAVEGEARTIDVNMPRPYKTPEELSRYTGLHIFGGKFYPDGGHGEPGNPGIATLNNAVYNMGSSTALKAVAFLVTRIPLGPGGTTAYSVIGTGAYDSANPAYIIYELLTNGVWGLGLDTSLIDEQSILDAAQTLQAEGWGLSMTITGQGDAGALISEINKNVGGTFGSDYATGKLRFRLIRNDFDRETIPKFNESSISEVTRFQRGSAGDAITEVRVKTTSPITGKPITASAFDVGARMGLATTNAAILEFPYAGTGGAAQRIATRELRIMSNGLASIEFVANRSAYGLSPGDPISVTFGPLGISDLVFRVTSVNLGGDRSGKIRVTAMEDLFSYDSAPYPVVVREDSDYDAGFADPVDIVGTKIIQRFSRLYPLTTLEDNPEMPAFKIAHTLDDDSWYINERLVGHMPTADVAAETTLSGNIAVSNEFGTENIAHIFEENEQRNAVNLAYIDDPVNPEWVIFDRIIDDGNGGRELEIQAGRRGLYDSVPSHHPVGTKVYFAGQALSQGIMTYDADTKDIALLSLNQNEEQLALEDAAVISVIGQANNANLIPVAMLTVDGVLEGDVSADADVDVTWKGRWGEAVWFGTDDDNGLSIDADSYSLEVIDLSNSTVYDSQTGLTTNSATVVTPPAGSYEFRVWVVDGADTSKVYSTVINIL